LDRLVGWLILTISCFILLKSAEAAFRVLVWIPVFTFKIMAVAQVTLATIAMDWGSIACGSLSK
jgi:hypothetical protein